MENVDTRDLIIAHLKEDDRSLAWLAKKSKLSYGHLYFVLVKKERDLSDSAKKEISKILKTKF